MRVASLAGVLVTVAAVSAGASCARYVGEPSIKVLIYTLDGWVWRADVDGRDPVRVARGLYSEASPDGHWVAFLRRTEKRDVFELRVAALEGPTSRLVGRGQIASYSWLPDSTRLLIHDFNKGVVLGDRRGGAETRLAPHVIRGAGAINEVNVAPDATYVVFDRRNTQRSDLFAVPVGGGPERRLTDDGDSLAPVAGPAAIAFTRYVGGRSPRPELWLMDPDGTKQRRLSRTAGRPAFWSADGARLVAVKLLATFSGGWSGEIWTVDIATSMSRSLYERPIEGLHAVGLSQDGKLVLAVRGCVTWGLSGKATPGRIELIAADGGKPRTLVRGPCHATWNA